MSRNNNCLLIKNATGKCSEGNKKSYENTNDNLNYVHLIEKNSPKINYHFCQINITPLL